MGESSRDYPGSRGAALPAEAARNRVVDLDISWLVPADLEAVAALARLQVTASQCGCWLEFHGADGGLAELVEFVGLGEVVHLCSCCDGSPTLQEARSRGNPKRSNSAGSRKT